jgi:hypothetical protein
MNINSEIDTFRSNQDHSLVNGYLKLWEYLDVFRQKGAG